MVGQCRHDFKYGNIGCSESAAEELLQDETDAPSREQRFQRAFVEKLDDAAFQRKASDRGGGS